MQANINWGLSQSDVQRRRDKHGWNEFNIGESEPLWKKYLMQVHVILLPSNRLYRGLTNFH